MTQKTAPSETSVEGRAQGHRRRAWFAGIGALLALGTGLGGLGGTADRREAVAEELGRRGLIASPEDIVFVDPPAGLWGSIVSDHRLVARARQSDTDPADIYLLRARLSPRGVLLGLSREKNLSDTTGAEETPPVVRGERVAFGSNSVVLGAPSVVSVIDLAGDSQPDWSFSERLMLGLTRYQRTGSFRGVQRRAYVVDAEASAASVLVGLDPSGFVVTHGEKQAVLGQDGAAAIPPTWMKTEPDELARPGNLVTWSVDRVRAEIGDDNMQAVKQVAFTVKDFFDRNREQITGDTGEASIAEDLGEDTLTGHALPVDPDLGWPPAPLQPWVTPELAGEGQWNAKDDPAFHRGQPGLPSVFLTTFIRSDRSRKATRVYVTLWDPRRVELHMMAGTVEPKSATGKAGPGLIPRTPDVMKRLVAATNAGFQALHGEYGMMGEGTVYLPPKPYAATVLKLRDGSTAFGTWPATPEVPAEVVSYRQNMTVMVQDEKFNPYDRNWWGGTVPGAEDKTHTVRTGICLTREKFVAYFYGADLSPEALAQAMIQTRCSYGLALDMNAGHSGLEYYNVAPEAELPALGRGIERSWEAEGDVPDLPGYRYRAKRLVKGMGLMNFPRYIKRESRDFFYLTMRHVLPGPQLQEGDAGKWETGALPQHGFPYALARSAFDEEAGKLRVLVIDPRVLSPLPSGKEPTDDAKTVLYWDPPAAAGGVGLWFGAGGFELSAEPSDKRAQLLATGKAEAGQAAGLVCVHDESQMLYYAEPTEPGQPASFSKLVAALAKIGCQNLIYLDAPLAVTLGDGNSLSGQPGTATRKSLRFLRGDREGGKRFFEDTPVVGKDVWYPLQQHRVRYFKKRDD